MIIRWKEKSSNQPTQTATNIFIFFFFNCQIICGLFSPLINSGLVILFNAEPIHFFFPFKITQTAIGIITDSFNSFSEQKCQILAGSSFLNSNICCFSLSFMTVNDESLSFGQKKHFQDVTLCPENLDGYLLTFLFKHFNVNDEH